MDGTETAVTQFIGALHFSTQRHQFQRRKNVDRTPYINHPIEVTYILSTVGGVADRDVLVAAVLHDTIEDTETTPEEIEERFGRKVRDLVLEVTDDKSIEKTVRKQRQIETAVNLSSEAALIRIADKISNVSDLATAPPRGWSKRRKLDYLDWTERVISELKFPESRLVEKYYEVLEHARKQIG